jgi:hypothetical protein
MSGSETNQKEAENAVVTVGEARGFVVEGEHSRFVITASHCLPHLPPVAAARAGPEQRTYVELLATLGNQPAVWAECLFVDPVSDLAVLGRPDGQALFDAAEAYESLMGASTALPVAEVQEDEAALAWLLSLATKLLKDLA